MRKSRQGFDGFFLSLGQGSEVSTIRVSGWIKGFRCESRVTFNPFADANGTDFIATFALLSRKLLRALKEYVVSPASEILMIRAVNLGAIPELVSVTVLVA